MAETLEECEEIVLPFQHFWVLESEKIHGDSDLLFNKYEPSRDKTNIIACVPSEDSDQPGHPPSLIRVFGVHSVGS